MTEPRDWLDDALDRHEGEPVPSGFAFRLNRRIARQARSRLLRFRWPLMLAASFLILTTGYWLGMGAPALSQPTQIGRPGDLASLELAEIYHNRELLEAWELLQDPDLELGFGETVAGAWAYGLDGVEESPR